MHGSGHEASPDFYVWVIAVFGDYGIRGEYMTSPAGRGIGLLKEQRPARLWGTVTGPGAGNWPPFSTS